MNLKQWRESKGITQKGFAGQLSGWIGGKIVSQQAVNSWENGQCPTLAKAEAIRKVTGGKVKPESFIKAN